VNPKLKNALLPFIPPLLADAYREIRRQNRFAGRYTDWGEALLHSTGYAKETILQRVLDATLLVKNGQAVYERDSVLFEKIEYSWPLLSGLLLAAAKHGGRLRAVDVGGALGSSYYQNKKFISQLKSVRWSVVEQPEFAECGRKFIADRNLRFYADLGRCLKKENPNIVLLSSILPYVEQPFAMIEQIVKSRVPFIVVDRTLFVEKGKERIVIQKVPPEIYDASYPCRIFDRDTFLTAFLKRYELLEEFDSHVGTVIRLDDTRATFKGFMFKVR